MRSLPWNLKGITTLIMYEKGKIFMGYILKNIFDIFYIIIKTYICIQYRKKNINEEPCPVTHTMLGALNKLYFLFNYTNLDFQDIILFFISMYKIKLQY